MDWKDIETVRVQGFTVARRGYDQREVDKFLSALIEWLEGDAAKDLGGMAMQRKLELAGRSTAQILLTTERESEQMRLQTEEECAELRAQAEAAALQARRAADEYANKIREKADQDARRIRDAASAKANLAIEEGERRRAQIEVVIGNLDAHRADTLRELERLHAELGSTLQKHPPPPTSKRRNGAKDGKKAQAAKKPERGKALVESGQADQAETATVENDSSEAEGVQASADTPPFRF